MPRLHPTRLLRHPAMIAGGVAIPTSVGLLRGDLGVVPDTRGLVVCIHGSGSGLTSWRNRYVAEQLQQQGFSTLLMDLLTPQEKEREALGAGQRYDIALMAGRVDAAIDWAARQRDLTKHGLGLYGASTGAGAALVAAAMRPSKVDAVVCRGGRPDLAGRWLAEVHVPVELIVGSADVVVLKLNREAMDALGGPRQLKVVPGATHLFEEPGALESVAGMAGTWFKNWLGLRGQRAELAQGL